MQKLDIGPIGSHKGVGVATLSFTPLFDRAAIVQRILLDAPSAGDVWVVSCSGREITRFRQYLTGNQQVLGGTGANFPKNADLDAFVNLALGQNLMYPVPQGQTLTIASVGGATANITMEYEEYDIGDVTPGMLNHPQGNHFLVPLWLHPPTNVTHAAGVAEDNYASQTAPSWFPQFWGQQELPAGFAVSILALFLEGAGANTFSGAANHQSISDHVALIKNGMRWFTRDALDGIADVGPAAAAGSANQVYGAVNTPFPAFQLVEYPFLSKLSQPIVIRPGDQFQWLFGTSGDSTGGADYSAALLLMILDVRVGSGI